MRQRSKALKLEISTSHHPRTIGLRPQSGDTVSCPQLLHMWDANVRAVRNRMRYVRDGAAELDWVSARTRHNGEVTRAGHPIPQGTTGVLEEEQYLRGAVGVSWLRVGQSCESLLVPPSPSRPLLKTLDTILATHYSQYMIDRGEIMDYIKQIRMQRHMKTPEYRLELYMAALYVCGEALY